MLQRTVTGGSAITMQTARRLDGSFLGVKAGAGIAGVDSAGCLGVLEENVEFFWLQTAHNAGKGPRGTGNRVAREKLVNASSAGDALRHRLDDVVDRLHGASGGKDASLLSLAGGGG